MRVTRRAAAYGIAAILSAGCGGGSARTALPTPDAAAQSPARTVLGTAGGGTVYVSGNGVVNAFPVGTGGYATPSRSIVPHPGQTDAVGGIAVASDATLNILQNYQSAAPGSAADCRVVVESPAANGTGPRQNQFACSIGGSPVRGIAIARDPLGIAYLETLAGFDYIAHDNSAVHQSGIDQSNLRLVAHNHVGLAVGAGGHVYVSSNGGPAGAKAEIENYAPNLALKIMAITGRATAGALALAPDNTTLYVATTDSGGAGYVDMVTTRGTSGAVTPLQTIGPFSNVLITALAVDQESRLYVGLTAGDGSATHVRVYAPNAGSGKPAPLFILQNPVPPPQSITGIALDELPAVAQPRPAQHALTEFSFGLSLGAGLGKLAAGPDGNLWFTETKLDQIGSITPGGAIRQYATGITAGSGPVGITSGPDGNLWFTESLGNRIGRITPAGVITEFSGLTSGASPAAITTGADGNLWFTESGGPRVGQITPAGTIAEFSAGLTRAAGAAGITSGPDGNLYIAETGFDRITRLPPGGSATDIANVSTGTSNVGFNGITTGPDGNLWITEFRARRIARVTLSGVIAEFSVGVTSGPIEIASGSDGNLWYTEALDRVGRITPAGSITEFFTASGAQPNGITSGPDGAIWFTEPGVNRIGRIMP